MPLTQKDGIKIAKKLNASISERKRHRRVSVTIDDTVIGEYGLSRGGREKSHSYIPRQIGVTARQAKKLAACSLSKDDYVEILQEEGLLPSKDNQESS